MVLHVQCRLVFEEALNPSIFQEKAGNLWIEQNDYYLVAFINFISPYKRTVYLPASESMLEIRHNTPTPSCRETNKFFQEAGGTCAPTGYIRETGKLKSSNAMKASMEIPQVPWDSDHHALLQDKPAFSLAGTA